MKAEEIRNLEIEELEKKTEELNQELFNLRFQLHTGHLENSSRIAQIKKDIARVKTILREKKLG
jgi:large subunit ribosomal protein L29